MESLRQRELEVAREIAHAFLTATQPVEVYRLALARVAPLVDASFASVFMRDPADPGLLRLVCAHNWPQASARYLSRLRIRVGRGPTGRAVAEARPVEARDVFAEPALREWWEPARELGFVAMISLPLKVRDEVAGALSFYFKTPHDIGAEERRLLPLIADQLAATAEKAHLIENLQDANRKLAEQNEELTRRVREAEEARRLKTEFLANISHEFRTPLTAILGYASMLRAGHSGALTEGQAAGVEKIERGARVLLGLVTDLLELSQLKLGRTAAHPRPVDAVAVAHRAADRVGPPPGTVAFRFEEPEQDILLHTDEEKVERVLENLLSNAFKFTAEGSVTVSVRTRAGRGAGSGKGGWVEWVVEDTGIGIRPDDLEAIFDEFRQVDGSSTRLYGGTGLGLALSLELARLLGGDITVDKRARARLHLHISPALPPGPGGRRRRRVGSTPAVT